VSSETLNYDTFTRIVENAADISHEAAERAVRATLQTLAERLSPGEVRDLAEQLPPEAAALLAPDRPSRRMHLDEFLRRVAEREGVDLKTATEHARAVLLALGRAISPRELGDVSAELPMDFQPLLSAAPGRHPSIMPIEVFLRKVADRAGVDVEQARRIADGVLETLAERVAAGEVEDLLSELPVELHEPLERGAKRTPKAIAMSVEDFIDRVGERAGTTHDAAHDYTRAVFATLREAVTREEFYDLSAELPREYAEVLGKP
jgi:uncharacterized protein (DUF2267 family)